MRKDWRIKTIKDVSFVLEDGDWIESKDQALEGIRLIQTGNIGIGNFKNRLEKARYISEYTFKKLKCTEIFEGDCLVSRLPDPIGRACLLPITDSKMITGVDCAIIRFDDKLIIPNWFIYFTQSVQYQKQIDIQSGGATRQRISRKNLALINLPLPQIEEQNQIISLIEQTFSAIDKAKDNAEQNLKNVKELFESYLQSVFENNAEGWQEKKIGEICDLIDSLHKTPKYTIEGEYSMVRVTEVKYGNLDISKALRVNKETYLEFSKKHKPKPGDIVFSRVGASFGVSSIVVKEEEFCLGQNTIFIIPKINSLLCYFFLNSRLARSQMNKLVAGAAQPTISMKSIRELKISLPSSKDEKKIVEDISEISAKTNRLISIYQQKIKDLEELKKSILQKAFNGELKQEELAIA